MGLMDKFLGYMKLGDDEDDGYYDDEYDDYDEAPVEKKPKTKSIQKADSYEEEERPRKAASESNSHASCTAQIRRTRYERTGH